MNSGVSQHFIHFARTKQIQRAPTAQLLSLSKEIPHHAPLILAAKGLQNSLYARQECAGFRELPARVVKLMPGIPPENNPKLCCNWATAAFIVFTLSRPLFDRFSCSRPAAERSISRKGFSALASVVTFNNAVVMF